MENRRQFLRVNAKLPAKYAISPSTAPHLTVTANIGGGGGCLLVNEPIAPGTFLAVEVTLPDEARAIAFSGRVVWCEQEVPPGQTMRKLGVEILHIDAHDHRAVTRYCLARLKEKGSLP